MHVSELVLEILSAHGVQHVFGVPGDAINDMTFALRKREDIEFILVRHEEAGAFAASAQAKLSGKLSCCMGTAGGGAIHLLNGLYDAKLDNAPVIAITGQVATEYVGTSYHQEVDLERLFSDVAVYSKTVMTEEQLPGVMLEACKAALSQRGVAHINLPTNIAGRSLDPNRCRFAMGAEAGETRPSDEALMTAVDLINNAKRCALLVGIGAADAQDEVVILAKKINAPIVRTLRAKDWIDDWEDHCVGGLGLLGGKTGSEVMEECDLLIIIGANFPYKEFYPKSATIIQIDSNPRNIGKRIEVDVALRGHARVAVNDLLPHLNVKAENRQDSETFLKSILDSKHKEDEDWAESRTSSNSPIRPQRLLAEIGRQAPENAIFLCDTGTATAWAARHLIVKPDQRFTLSSGLGSMAFALSGAIGAQLSFPERPVIAITGDGGFAMLMADFVTAVKYDLPITVIVLNNGKLGFIALEQEGKGLPEHDIDLLNPDFAKFAEACGGVGLSVEDPSDLTNALLTAFGSNKPSLINVTVNPDELILPPTITLSQAYHFGIAKIREAIS